MAPIASSACSGRAIVGAESVLRSIAAASGTRSQGLDKNGHFDTYHNPIQPGLKWPNAMKEINPPAGTKRHALTSKWTPAGRSALPMVDPDGQPISGVAVRRLRASDGYKEPINKANRSMCNELSRRKKGRTIYISPQGPAKAWPGRKDQGTNRGGASPIPVKLQPVGEVKGPPGLARMAGLVSGARSKSGSIPQ